MFSTPAHIAAMSTPLADPVPYRFPARLYDSWWIGRRDADARLAHEAETETQPSASLRTLEAVLQERCERERMNAVRIAAPLIDRRTTLVAAGAALQDQIDEWSAEIERHKGQPSDASPVVAKTEAHLDPSQRAARRARESAAQLAPLVARRDDAVVEAAGIPAELAEIDGRLTTLFESLRARVTALAHHYERRSSTQIRGYLRHTPGVADHPLNVRRSLRAPGWAVEPNPWLDGTRATAAVR